MKSAFLTSVRRALAAVLIGLAAMLVIVLPTAAQQQGFLTGTEEQGYGRLILTFPTRNALPTYQMRVENNVLSLTFDEPVAVTLPDVGTTMPTYLSAARVDPDGRGLRMALRGDFTVNKIDAGEKLFLDLMPTTWQGMPPSLPQDVIDGLAERARLAAIDAERERKARGVEDLNPQATMRVGRNPTFIRLQFDWTVPTTASYAKDGNTADVAFEWPVGVDVRDFSLDLPPEVTGVQNTVDEDGSTVALQLADGVTPRFYQNSPQQIFVDIDIKGDALPSFTPASLSTAEGVNTAAPETVEPGAEQPRVQMLFPEGAAPTVKPFVSVLGSTVRVVFPFEQDTPAAVFRRGDQVWMIFDTLTGIEAPTDSTDLNALASDFAVNTSGDTQVVRIQLSQDRLATLGSEGMAWVLSLGDIMLTPTEPINLSRRRDMEGAFEVTADVARPARIHDFSDPIVGDRLKVVTAYPPARGVTRTLDYVDFAALRSVHGLVLKPENPDLQVAIDNTQAVISTPGGLTVSDQNVPRSTTNGITQALRASFIDMNALVQPNYGLLNQQVAALSSKAASDDGKARDTARLDLARFYVANQFAYEALGVLNVMEEGLQTDELAKPLRLTRAIADTLAARPREALNILNGESMGQEIDALLWRAIARADAQEYAGAKLDAVEANSVAESYPAWVRNKFYFAATRAAVETGDPALAERFIGQMDYATLSPEDASLFNLLQGRIDEARGRFSEAIDIYGQVIAADIRPTRAEAIYRTLRILDQQGLLDLQKASATLSAEALLWRGNPLDAEMQAMLADLYFREGDYRNGFDTVRAAVSSYPESAPVNTMSAQAQQRFGELFLDGAADQLGPIEALSLYYDFRQLTPPGTRGDEMIRNLARRLVRMDLLPQAAQLLEYQLDNRLKGVARTQVATDLAVIYLADRRPQDALRVLNATRLPDLPVSLQRQRRILEARAMIDGGRDQLALDLLRDINGEDVSLLRIDADWKARRYSQASEKLEQLYSGLPVGQPMAQTARMGLIRAAVGYVMANDQLGLSRLRSKFADAMVTTPEWPMFDLVTGQISVDSLEFKAVASQVSDVQGINAFLTAYRNTYGNDGALAPLNASDGSGGLAQNPAAPSGG